MNTKDITRLMINTAADRGLKEMTDDPKRALRKLVDMGSEFSTGRFQPEIFSIITNILENEDSPYYKLIRDFLFTSLRLLSASVPHCHWNLLLCCR